MKRLNKATNSPFKKGDTRHDGKVFRQYTSTILEKTGYFKEVWVSPVSLTRQRHKDAKRKQSLRPKNPNRLPYGSAKDFNGDKRAIAAYKKLATLNPTEIDWEWGVPPDLAWLKKYFTL